MAKRNGSSFIVEPGSEFFECPRIDTGGGKLSLKHLLEKVYSKKNEECKKCGVCEASLKSEAPAQDIVSTTTLQEMVRPHGWRATREKAIRIVSAGKR
jgi:hypothetical protein